jgi:hypothetical protein
VPRALDTNFEHLILFFARARRHIYPNVAIFPYIAKILLFNNGAFSQSAQLGRSEHFFSGRPASRPGWPAVLSTKERSPWGLLFLYQNGRPAAVSVKDKGSWTILSLAMPGRPAGGLARTAGLSFC